jgi:hypothetical protein
MKGWFTEMSRKRSYQISAIVLFITASLLIGFLVWQHRARPDDLIGQEQAIQNAIQACNPSYGLRPVEQPTEFQAERSTYGEALHYVSNPPNSENPVWIVKMKGRWLLVGGPPPADPSHSELAYWEECTIVIDAQTGESLSLPIE